MGEEPEPAKSQSFEGIQGMVSVLGFSLGKPLLGLLSQQSYSFQRLVEFSA